MSPHRGVVARGLAGGCESRDARHGAGIQVDLCCVPRSWDLRWPARRGRDTSSQARREDPFVRKEVDRM